MLVGQAAHAVLLLARCTPQVEPVIEQLQQEIIRREPCHTISRTAKNGLTAASAGHLFRPSLMDATYACNKKDVLAYRFMVSYGAAGHFVYRWDPKKRLKH